MVTPKERESTRERIAECCRKLILSQRMVELCEQESTPKQEEFLAYVLEQEILRREQNKRTRQLNRACFPVMKNFEGYEFGAIRFPPALMREDLHSWMPSVSPLARRGQGSWTTHRPKKSSPYHILHPFS